VFAKTARALERRPRDREELLDCRRTLRGNLLLPGADLDAVSLAITDALAEGNPEDRGVSSVTVQHRSPVLLRPCLLGEEDSLVPGGE
jgi:hypothetical protein